MKNLVSLISLDSYDDSKIKSAIESSFLDSKWTLLSNLR